MKQILERIAEAIQETTGEVHSYMKERPEFADTGQRMLLEWENGVSTSFVRLKPLPVFIPTFVAGSSTVSTYFEFSEFVITKW